MRKSILIFIFTLIGVFSARAYDFEVDGIYYNILSGTDQVEVTFSGYTAVQYSGSVEIPTTVTNEGTTYAVTSIGKSAFGSCAKLTSVTIGESVTTIGAQAFYHCTGLTSVTIPNSVTSIGIEAFCECSGLTSVTIGEGVTSIGTQAFYGCSGLTSVTIPNSVSSISNSTFKNCKGLTSVTIGEGVTSIGNSAFSGCSSLTSVEWNAINCQNFNSNNSPFYDCEKITAITFGDKVEHIPAYLCYECSGLTSVTIPNGVTSIGARAFCTCTGLTSVTIGEGVTSIGSSTFSYCRGLTSVTIGNSVTSIGNNAFYKCTGLTSVTIPESVTTIGELAFSSCSGLTSVTIGEGVTSIGEYAFENCSGLTAVTIPNGVTSIGSSAFKNCSGLTSVTSLATVPPSYGSSAFDVHDTLWVPCGSKTAYKGTEGWSSFNEIIGIGCVYVTLSVNDETMGSVTGDKEYDLNGQATLEATPNQGYHFVKWNDENTDNPRTLTVTQDTTLTAEFAINTYTVTAQANDAAMGTVSGGNEYAHGAQVTLEAVPNTGYHFVQWNDENTDNPRTLTVAGDITLTAEFAPTIYTMTAQANDAAMGTVSGGNEYAYGTEATLEAIPNEGYHFVKWNDDNIENPRILTVTCDTAFTAEFAINTYTVTAQANDAAMGTVSGGNEYAHGAQVTLEAVPNTGYHFMKWDDENTDNPRTLTITKDSTLTAVFVKDEEKPDDPVVKTFTLSVAANNPAWGRVSQSGNGTYDSASSVTITATPNEGYRFINWTKGEAVFSTQAEITFMVTENLTLLANFEKIPDEPVANENRKDDHFRVYVQDRTIHLSEDRGSVQVYNMAGQCVYNGHSTSIPVPRSGVYIVAIGQQRFKVLVR